MTYYDLPEEFYDYWPIPVWGGFIVTIGTKMFYWDSEKGTSLPVSGEIFDVDA